MRWAVLVAALLVLPGCAFFTPPPPVQALSARILAPTAAIPAELQPTPAAWSPESSSSDDDTARTAPQSPPLPLTLDEAIRWAEQNSPRLRLQRARVGRARAGQDVAFAAFLPEAAVSYRYVLGTKDFALPTLPTYVGNTTFGGEADTFRLAELQIQWNVWDFGRTPGRYGQASAAAEIAERQYQRARQTIAFDVTAAYFSVLQQQARRTVAEQALRRAESNLRDAHNFLARGTAVRNDVLRAQVLVDQVSLDLVSARTAEGIALAALNRVLGVNAGAPLTLVDLRHEPRFDLSLERSLQLAVDHRPEFKVVLETLRAAQLGLGVAQADFLPRVYVGGVGGQFQGHTQKPTDLFAGGINVELAVFEGGKRVGAMRAAQAELDEALAQGEDICDAIAYEVHQAYLLIDDARQRLALARAASSQGEENRRVVGDLFDNGDATGTDLVDAELTLVRAQQDFYAALYDSQTAVARLAFAVGAEVEPL